MGVGILFLLARFLGGEVIKKIIIAVFLALPFQAHCDESFPAPFGLQWGMSEASLEKLGFSRVDEPEGLTVLSSVSVPKAWSKGEMYIAVTYQGRLVKAIVTSEAFSDDIYGVQGKREYEHMKVLLADKYGSPEKHYEIVGRELFDEPNEFYQCLNYAGCGGYLSFYKFSGGTIALQLSGRGRGEGYLKITYESPLFFEAKDDVAKHNAESDEKAF